MNRRKRRRRAPNNSFSQLPFQQFCNPFAPWEIASEDELEAIHQASLRVLAEHGLQFDLSEARTMLQENGAEIVDGGPLVRLDPDLVMEWIARAPPASPCTRAIPRTT